MNNKITLPELISRHANTTSTTQRMSELFLRELFACITQSLANGEKVTIKDFGQFSLSEKLCDDGKKTVVFTPAKQFAEILNQPFEAFVPVELADDISDDLLDELNGTANDTNEESLEDLDASMSLENSELSDTPEYSESSENSENSENIDQSEQCDESDANEDIKRLEIDQIHNDEDVVAVPQTERQVAKSRSSFVKGVFAGATGMLVSCLIGYLIGNKTATHVETVTDTIVTTSIDSIDTEPITKPVVTDTTSATMYLTRIARKHYGSADFWVYIYEENKEIINNPNNIPPGTVVVIPPAEKYGIDASNKESIEKARKRSFELFSKLSK